MQLKHKNQPNIKIILCLIVATLLTVSGTPVSRAASSNPVNNPPAEYTLLEPLPCIPSPAIKDSDGKEIPNTAVTCSGVQKTTVQFQDYVQYAFNLLIALAAVAAVFMIVYGGFVYMTSDSFQNKSDGLRKLENAVYGLLLVLSAYLILRTIDPRLVTIPTTLVAPLNITYKPDEVATFFKQLSDDANRYRTENMQIINNVAKGQQQYDQMEAQKKALCDKLLLESGYGTEPVSVGMYKDACHALMAQSSTMSATGQGIAREIQDLENQQTKLGTDIAKNQAVGIINAKLQKCYGTSNSSTSYWFFFDAGNGYTMQDCMKEISDAGTKYSSLLANSGQPDAAKQVQDYQKYAESITRVNAAVLTNMSSSPDMKAFVDTLQTTVTTAAIAGGAVYGGPVGAIGGLAVSQALNGIVIGAPVAASKSAAAQRTISDIQLEVNNNINSITDSAIREQYKTQAYMIIKKLGGKGDGTDSTKYATPTTVPAYSKIAPGF